MVQRLPEGYVFDPDDPRSPTEEVWARMTPEQRVAVIAMLPSEFEPIDVQPAEGDLHAKATAAARFTLDAFFRRVGWKIYVSSNLPVYYPGEPCFAPDVLAVRDVEPHDRERWAVVTERKGLDFVLEVHVSGDRAKDEKRNVEKYARLGIKEYFYFDRGRRVLRGHRLPEAQPWSQGRPSYQPIVPQQGYYSSEVLGLDLVLEGDRLRFMYGMAPVPEADELIAKLGRAMGEVVAAKEEAERRAEEEARRAEEEARRREEAERALAEALAEIERLRGGG
jgi:Uma2 family endonuclease